MDKKESYFKPKISYKERYHQESLLGNYRSTEVLHRLLDSRLISQTNKKFINMKIIDCGDYKHIYEYKNLRIKKEKDLIKLKDNKVALLPKVNKSYKNTCELQEISMKNIIRTKIQFQRLIQCNLYMFKTFITLTFADNITDIGMAHKKFNIWRTKIKSIYKDFAYVCVPEFQKRGAVHYHLLTNLDIKDSDIIIPQKNKKNQYDVKYWSYGYTSVFTTDNISIIGYMSKYMTKDIDNRLFSKRRYFYSTNLKKPIEYNLDFSKIEDFDIYCRLFENDYELNYFRDYEDFYGENVKYREYILKK